MAHMKRKLVESYLAGVISGDGSMQKYFIQIDGDNKEWLSFINGLFQLLFGKRGKITRRGKKCFRLYINSREIVKFFNEEWCIPLGKKSHSVRPPRERLTENAMRVYYAIGWLDSEGTVEDWKKGNHSYKRIQFKTKSREVRDFLFEILQENDIEACRYEDKEGSFRIQIAKESSIRTFGEKLNFFHPKKRARLLKGSTPPEARLKLKGIGGGAQQGVKPAVQLDSTPGNSPGATAG